MGLEDIILPVTEVAITKDQKVAVKGLGLAEVLALIPDYQDQLARLFEKFTEMSESDLNGASLLSEEMIGSMPDLVARIIAMATGSDTVEARAIARKLNVGVQLEILDNAIRMTFDMEGGPKKLIALIGAALKDATMVMHEGNLTLKAGSGS